MEAERPPPQSPDQAPAQHISRRTARPGFPNLLSIPLELQRAIASNLDVSDLCNLRATCKQLERGLYETYVQSLLETPKLTRWLASTVDPMFRINWTEAGLQSAAFMLGIKRIAEHAKTLAFITRDCLWSDNDALCAYNFIPDDADWPKERTKLVQNASRCVRFLEIILRSTPNVQTIALQPGARWPTTVTHLWEESRSVPNDLIDVQEAHEYTSSEESLYDGECITQAFTALVSTLAQKGQAVRKLRVSGNFDYRMVSIETVEQAMSHISPDLERTLANLRSLDLAMQSYGFTCEFLKSADKCCPNISDCFRRLTRLENLTLGSTAEGLITPKVTDSILPSIHQTQALANVRLETSIIRQETMTNFLSSCGKTLRSLTMYDLSVLGTWKPIFDILRQYPTLDVNGSRFFELTSNGNYTVVFGRRGVQIYYSHIGNHPEPPPLLRRIEWSINEPVSQSRRIRDKCSERPKMGTSTILWAGIYYAAQHDEVLEDTREIRAWD
ncbi:hypothetical protein BKA80DRAFT_267300 [Phyllosticta citrichinensis]